VIERPNEFAMMVYQEGYTPYGFLCHIIGIRVVYEI